MWTSIIAALAAFFGSLVNITKMMSNNQMIQAGKDEDANENLSSTMSEIKKAEEVRDSIIHADPSKLREDDGFKRPN